MSTRQRMTSIFMLFCTMIFVQGIHNCNGENYWGVCGERGGFETTPIGHPPSILRIEVLDQDSHWPIKNANIIAKISGAGGAELNLFTGNDGIVIVIIKTSTMGISLDLEIRARGYRPVDKHPSESALKPHIQSLILHTPKTAL